MNLLKNTLKNTLKIIVWSFFCSTISLFAYEAIDVGQQFRLHFWDGGEGEKGAGKVSVLGTKWTKEQKAAATRALKTWSNVIKTPFKAPRMNLNFYLSELAEGTSAYSSASPSYWPKSKLTKMETYSGFVWKDGKSPVDWIRNRATIQINVKDEIFERFYYGEDPSKIPAIGYDFESMILHEMGHIMGIKSWFTAKGSAKGKLSLTAGENGLFFYSDFDLLLKNEKGEKIINLKSNSGINLTNTGEKIYIDKTREKISVYNPNVYAGGSSISHIDVPDVAKSNVLMKHRRKFGQTNRQISTTDKSVLKAIGWQVK